MLTMPGHSAIGLAGAFCACKLNPTEWQAFNDDLNGRLGRIVIACPEGVAAHVIAPTLARFVVSHLTISGTM